MTDTVNRDQQLPVVDHGHLWCSCDTPISFQAAVSACPTCGRPLAEVHAEAAYNADVMRFVESKPMDWGCPRLDETKVEWWARMVAAYEAEQKENPA